MAGIALVHVSVWMRVHPNAKSTLSKSLNLEYLCLYIQTDEVYFHIITGLSNHM